MSTAALPTYGNEVIRRKLTVLFVSATLIIVMLYRHWPASRLWLPAALAGIALAIWHGAYDTVLAANLWQPRYPGRWLLPFVAGYVALAGCVVIAWHAFPVAALAAFLLYSGTHFGIETEHERGPLQRASAIAFGCLPIAAACHWQAGSVLPIFANMLRNESDAASRIILVAGALLAPCILLAAVPVWRNRSIGVRRTALIVAQLLLFRFCSPVLAFAVFFCLLHTPEHLIETSKGADYSFRAERMWRNLRSGIAPWLISLAAVGAAAWMGQRTIQEYTASLFVSLSALTVPHMALAMFATADARRKEKLPFRAAQGAVHS